MGGILDVFTHIEQQGEKGKQSRLGRMLGEAYNAPMGQRQEALGNIAKVDGGLAMQAGRQFREEDGEVLSQLSDHARQVVALYKADPNMAQQAYQAMLPLAQRAGITTAPQQLDDTVIGGLTQLAEVNVKAGVPAGIQEFDYLTRTAGLEGDDRARAARINLGMDPRASSAAIQYREVEGLDGRKRLVALDPRDVGAQTIGSGMSYGSGVPSPQAPQQYGSGEELFAGLDTIAQVTSGFRTPKDNERVGGVANSRHLDNMARDVLPPRTQEQARQIRQFAEQRGLKIIDEGDHWHLQPPSRGAVPSADPFTSRRPEDEAAAKAAAERAVLLQTLPEELRLRVESELAAAAGKAGVEADAEIDLADAKRSRDADDTLGLLSKAETLLANATGSGAGAAIDAAAGFFGASTSGAQATASLKTVAGQLVSKMPRMEGPQSDRDVQLYKDMAGNLADNTLPVETRMAALRTIQELNQRYANDPTGGAARGRTAPKRARNPQTGEVLELRDGRWVPAQ